MIQVKGGDRPQAVGGEELLLVEELGKYPLEPFHAHHPEEKLPVARFPVEDPGFRQLLRIVEPLVVEQAGELLFATSMLCSIMRSSMTAAASTGITPTIDRTFTGTTEPSGVTSRS